MLASAERRELLHQFREPSGRIESSSASDLNQTYGLRWDDVPPLSDAEKAEIRDEFYAEVYGAPRQPLQP